jgi:hypothetical protein
MPQAVMSGAAMSDIHKIKRSRCQFDRASAYVNGCIAVIRYLVARLHCLYGLKESAH